MPGATSFHSENKYGQYEEMPLAWCQLYLQKNIWKIYFIYNSYKFTIFIFIGLLDEILSNKSFNIYNIQILNIKEKIVHPDMYFL